MKFSLTLFLFFYLGIAANAQCPASPPSGTDCVASGANKDITAFSTCAKITNSHTSGKALFVPIATSTEWSTFRSKLPSGVTSGACGSSLTPLTLANIQGFAGFETGTLYETGAGATVAAATFAHTGLYSYGSPQGTLMTPSSVSVTVNNSASPQYSRVYVYLGTPVDNTEKELIAHDDGSQRIGA